MSYTHHFHRKVRKYEAKREGSIQAFHLLGRQDLVLAGLPEHPIAWGLRVAGLVTHPSFERLLLLLAGAGGPAQPGALRRSRHPACGAQAQLSVGGQSVRPAGLHGGLAADVMMAG